MCSILRDNSCSSLTLRTCDCLRFQLPTQSSSSIEASSPQLVSCAGVQPEVTESSHRSLPSINRFSRSTCLHPKYPKYVYSWFCNVYKTPTPRFMNPLHAQYWILFVYFEGQFAIIIRPLWTPLKAAVSSAVYGTKSLMSALCEE